MIVNVFSITMLFIAVLSAGLGIFCGIASFLLFLKWGRSLSTEERTAAEDRAYLVLLVACVVLGIRVLSWPMFYAALHSFVPEVPGAMCIYGVTQVWPGFTRFMQIIKPTVFFLIGAWLLVYLLDRATQTYPLMRRKFLLLTLVSLVLLVDAGADLRYFTGMKPAPVFCCTTVYDLPDRPTDQIPRGVLGAEYERFMVPAFYGGNLLLIALTVLVLGTRALNVPGAKRKLLLGGIFVLDLLNLPVFLWMLFERISPALMGLPYHHCPYCLMETVLDAPLILTLFIVGSFGLGWAFFLDVLGSTGETREILPRYLRGVYVLSLVGLSGFLLMVSAHFLVG